MKQNRDNIPASIAEQKRFFPLWGSGKDNTPTGWNTPENWLMLEDIPEDKYFGYVLSDTQVLIDFDHVFDDKGKMVPEVRKAYERLKACGNTYTELSQSGKGLHMIIDLGDYADCFEPISNNSACYITPTMPIEEYQKLSKPEKDETPKIELFYRTAGRYVYLTGQNKKVYEVAKNEMAAEMFRECLKMVDECHPSTTNGNKGTANLLNISKAILQKDIAQVKEWLNYIDSDDREIWIKVGIALYKCGYPFEIWDEWSRKSDKYNDGKDEPTDKKWHGFSRSKSKWNIGTICTLAKEGGWKNATTEETSTNEPKKKRFDIKLVQGIKLQEMELPEIRYPIDGFIPEGSTIFAGPFKYGKSWLVLEACLAIAEGSNFLGMNTIQGKAVYFALEDSDKFAQERLNIATNYKPAPEDFYYIYEDVPTLDEGLIDYLDQLYEELGDIRLVVIDTLAKVEYQAKRGESAYHRDYRTGSTLKNWADSKGTSIVLVTHTTKMEHSDIFQNTTGTNGTTGACDAIITLNKKKRSEKNGILAVTGRRVREKYLKVRFDDNSCVWHFEGITDADQMEVDDRQAERDKDMAEYMSSHIREAVLKIASSGITDDMYASTLKDKASELGVYLIDSPRDIGIFIKKYQNHLITVDNVKVSIINNGSGAKRYKFGYYEDATPDEAKIFE